MSYKNSVYERCNNISFGAFIVWILTLFLAVLSIIPFSSFLYIWGAFGVLHAILHYIQVGYNGLKKEEEEDEEEEEKNNKSYV